MNLPVALSLQQRPRDVSTPSPPRCGVVTLSLLSVSTHSNSSAYRATGTFSPPTCSVFGFLCYRETEERSLPLPCKTRRTGQSSGGIIFDLTFRDNEWNRRVLWRLLVSSWELYGPPRRTIKFRKKSRLFYLTIV